VDSFNGAINSQGGDRAKQADMAKRLPSLISALDKGEVKGDAVQLLVQICRACAAGDHAGANKNLQDLGTSQLLPAKDLIGVKRFVELSKR
jgi:hypothetical protein